MKTNLYFLITAAAIILSALTACSNNKTESEVASALPLMVIDQSEFQNDYMKKCVHTSQCQAPLVCMNKTCIIPPSILGKTDENTPKLFYQNAEDRQFIYIEIVSDDYTTQRGMMMRRACHPEWGMLFVFPSEAKHAFWMHNTYIPLDMVFIRVDGSVSNIHENAEALNDIPRYPSTDKVKYVLELPAGSVQKHQISLSTKFDVSQFHVSSEDFRSNHIFNSH